MVLHASSFSIFGDHDLPLEKLCCFIQFHAIRQMGSVFSSPLYNLPSEDVRYDIG